MSLNSITGNILINFQNMPGSQEEKDYQKEVYSAIKLQLAELETYDKTDRFNHCKKCQMVLTVEDKASVYDWEEIESNPTEFKDIYEKCKEDTDRVVWICSFCENKNVLQPSQVKFARNNSRVVQKAAVQGQRKDPMLLIVFDISGSMDQVLSNEQSSYSSLVERIKKTKIYQKIVREQQQQINQMLKKHNMKPEQLANKDKYQDFLKKNKLLMGLTESLLTDMNQNANEKKGMSRSGGYQPKSTKPKHNKNIGFILFNSNVIIEPCNHDQEFKGRVIVCDSHGNFSTKSQGMSRERVNFDDFQSLYKLGATYSQEYTTKMNQFQFANLDLNFGDSNSGQTALGPAIVIAAGVISQHGPGSSIVVVTDGIGNKGIFDQSQKWQQSQKLLKMRLQRHKSFLAMLECRNINQGNRQKDINNIRTCMDDFCQTYDQMVAKKINILLNKNKTAQNLIEDIRQKMNVCINRDNVIWTNQVNIKSQNPCVTFEGDMNKLSQKLHNTQALTYIHPKIDATKLKQKDYMHHFMIQAVVRYQNTQTGEQSTFMSYQLRKIIKFNTIRKQTLKKLDNQKTFHDMMEYLSVEEENYDISNMQLGFVKKTFRDTLMFSKSICNRSMRFPMRIGEGKEEEANFFQELERRTKEIIKEEEDEEEHESAL